MTREQLKQANKINSEIKKIETLISYLKSENVLSICRHEKDCMGISYWHSICILEEGRKELLEYYQQKLKDLEKELASI